MIGQEDAKFDPESDSIKLSTSKPIFMRKDSPTRFEWRIRNLPYPKEVYSVSIDHDRQQIVLRTSNKKYFKRIDIPELKELGLEIQEESISWKYSNSTLLIAYIKPQEVLDLEKQKISSLTKSDAAKGGPQEGSVD